VADGIGAGTARPGCCGVGECAQCRCLRLCGFGAQQLPPALQEQRAVVELDREQVAFVEALLREQAVADLPAARAVDVTAIAETSQRDAIDDAAVGGPQAMACGSTTRGACVGAE
jgi:hypothetical protein